MLQYFLSAILALLAVSGPRQARVQEILRSEPALKGAQVSILAVRSGRDTLVAVNPDQRCVPASNMKLLTSGTALRTLGAGFRFETALAYSGEVRDSVLRGDLYIVGGADPTLGSPYRSCTPADTLFRRWTGLVKAAGISRIDGRVIGDARWLDGQVESPSWCYEDLGADYGAGPTGLNFHRNVLDVDIVPGLSTGERILAVARYPGLPKIRLSSTAVTSPAGCGDELYLCNTDLAPAAQLRGSYSADRPAKTMHCSNRFAALSCAGLFRRALEEAGITVLGSYADISPDGMLRDEAAFPEGIPAPCDSLTRLGSTFSPRLGTILRDLNHESDNFYAETLLRTVGKTITGSACYDSSQVAVKSVLKGMGLDTRPIRIEDGSGLSRKNFVPASFFVSFLGKMAVCPESKTFISSLPGPGAGTLSMFLRSAPESVRQRIRMKSGSMGGVRCYSGYVLPENGQSEDAVVFSVLVNDVVVPGRAAAKAVEKIILEIAR